jgi:hypothetical protein
VNDRRAIPLLLCPVRAIEAVVLILERRDEQPQPVPIGRGRKGLRQKRDRLLGLLGVTPARIALRLDEEVDELLHLVPGRELEGEELRVHQRSVDRESRAKLVAVRVEHRRDVRPVPLDDHLVAIAAAEIRHLRRVLLNHCETVQPEVDVRARLDGPRRIDARRTLRCGVAGRATGVASLRRARAAENENECYHAREAGLAHSKASTMTAIP